MSDNDTTLLELATTSEILDELARRHDAVMLAATQPRDGGRTWMYVDWRGDVAASLGLISAAYHKHVNQLITEWDNDGDRSE